MTIDGIPWQGAPCPDCGRELDTEPVASSQSLRVAYTCSVHGLIYIEDRFPDVRTPEA